MKTFKVILMTAITGIAIAHLSTSQAAAIPATVTTVKQALKAKDNTPVKLHGQVVKSIGDEKYQFRDKTGTIIINVDDELWQGHPISPTINVGLVGEVDIDFKPSKHVEIDVEQVQF